MPRTTYSNVKNIYKYFFALHRANCKGYTYCTWKIVNAKHFRFIGVGAIKCRCVNPHASLYNFECFLQSSSLLHCTGCDRLQAFKWIDLALAEYIHPLTSLSDLAIRAVAWKLILYHALNLLSLYYWRPSVSLECWVVKISMTIIMNIACVLF